jgi:peptide-methionine (S)-S-oxide reductase
MNVLQKIALGGGCHWCTEAVFQSIIGVEKVEQGFVASIDENNSFSEAVIVHFNSEVISLNTLSKFI